MIDLSVVICSRNGAARLPLVLGALERQSLPRNRYEVIVVDDGSTDSTASVARNLGARVVRLVAPAGLAAARNVGVQVAAASLIAFTDDDCKPEADWLQALVRVLTDAAVDGVGGRVTPVCEVPFLRTYLVARNPLTPLPADLLADERPSARLRRYLRTAFAGDHELAPGALLYAPVGANMALRRELLEALGGFDESFEFGMEDEELCLRAHARVQHTLLLYEPGAVVEHQFRPALSDGIRRAHAYGRGHGQAAAKHRRVRPIVYPLPILQLVAVGTAMIRRQPALAIAAVLAPPVGYGRWAALAWRRRSTVALVYAYLQLAEEIATMVGELRGRAGV